MDGKNRDSGSPKRETAGRDGVVYTPSAEARRRAEADMITRRTPVKPKQPAAAVRKKPVKKPQKSQFAIFFVIVTFFGAIACVVTFAMVFSSFAGKPGETPRAAQSSVKPSQTPLPTQAPEDGKSASMTGVVLNSYADAKKLEIYDYESAKELTVYLDTQTDMKDKYGKAMAFNEFVRGDIVDIVYSVNDGKLSSLRSSVNDWSFKNVTGAKVDEAAFTVAFGQETYTYDANTVISYKGEAFVITELDAVDTVSLKGYKIYLSSLEVTKSHGTVTLDANPDVINGTVELDTSTIFEFGEEVSETVPEGDHRAVIKGTNIEPQIVEFTLRRNETYKILLSDLKFTSGKLTVTANEPDSMLTVNGAVKVLGEPINMPFGEVEIKVEKDGYTPWEQLVDFNEPNLEVGAYLEQIKTTGLVTVSTQPDGASVFLDGVLAGISPCTFEAEYGTRIIAVEKAGYLRVEFPIDVGDNHVKPNVILQSTGGY